jgi:hypothetical protein
MSALINAVILVTTTMAGNVGSAGGDFESVPFVVPANSVECTFAHTDGDPNVILDWGLWSPNGFRGWGGGLADDTIVNAMAASRGYLPGPMTAGTWYVVVGKAKLVNGAGHYDITMTCTDTATLAPALRSTFEPVVAATGARWYQGDLHVHSEQSGDANASLMQIANFAKSRGLDFVAVSDHNTIAQHGLIATAQKQLSNFLLLRSVEITTYRGHGNALGVSSYVDHRVGFTAASGSVKVPSAATIIDDVVAQGGIFSINHPELRLGNDCIGCAWDHADTPWNKVAGIEVLTGPYDVGEVVFTPPTIERWDEQENAGHQTAALGGSDDHRGGTETSATKSPIGSPTTVVYADNLSEAGIIAAIKAKRTFVKLRGPADPDVEFFVRKPDGSMAMIGDTASDLIGLEFTVQVKNGSGTFAGIWRNGELAKDIAIDSDDFATTIKLVPSGAMERFRIELTDDGGRRLAITSHIYAQGTPADDGCGCRGDGNAGIGASGIFVLTIVTSFKRRRSRSLT